MTNSTTRGRTMVTLNKDVMMIVKEQDVIPCRHRIKEYSIKIGMSLVNQTKIITAASELIRNMLKYGNGGKVYIEVVSKGRDNGIRLTFEDKGPGIKDIDLALRDGYSTGKSLGLGLPGAKRLVSEFDIQSEVGKGTTVTVVKWRNG